MALELALPGEVIALSAQTADTLLRSGSGDGALLYLWLLRHGGDTPLDKARHAFGWDGVRLEAAQAVLTGLSRLDGEEVRAFWEAELEHEPGSIQFLENLTQDWASDLAAAGLRRRLELALDGDDKSAPPSAGSVRQWCLAAQGKTSPQMLDCWRWIDRRTASIRQKSEDYVKLFTGILLDSLCQSGGPLCGLCLELWEALAALLERSEALLSQALVLTYGGTAGDGDRALAEELGKRLTKTQIVRTIELMKKYRRECGYNVGPGHVLGALAAELEEIF